MTPDTATVGGIAKDEEIAIARSDGDDDSLRLRYPQGSGSAASYTVTVEPDRLSVVLRRGEQGWIANAPELNALGYGGTLDAALEDLREGIEEYLEFLRDETPELAPNVAHHAVYVRLLDAPSSEWFASVSVDAADVE